MAFDRNRWKGASTSVNKELSEKTEKMTKSSGGSSDRPGFHTIEDGTNVFRICPPHNPDEPSFQPKCTTWLEIEVNETDKDGKETGKKILKKRPIFNSRVHGGTPKDLVEEYINFVYKSIYDQTQDKDERSKKLAPISGWRGKDGKWNSGIRYSTSYIFYAFKNNKLARLELMKGDKDRMEELNISEDAEDPIVTDVFSDPNEGVSLIIDRKKDDKNKYYNVVAKREFNPKKFKTWDEFMASERLTDEQLMELDKAESLKTLYQNAFKRSDFEKQLEGLRIFDEKNKFQVFENDEFLDIVQEIDGYYPEDGETKFGDEVEDVDEKPNLKSEKAGSGKPKGKFDNFDRGELKLYIKEKGLPIIVKTSMTDDVLRQLITEAEEAPQVNDEVEDEVEDVVEHQPEDKKDLPWEKEERNVAGSTTNASSGLTPKEKIAQMKAKMAANKK